MMTPIYLSTLLHIYTSPALVPGRDNEQVKEILFDMVEDGLIENTNGSAIPEFKTTLKANVFIKMILETPLPEYRWIDTRTGKSLS